MNERSKRRKKFRACDFRNTPDQPEKRHTDMHNWWRATLCLIFVLVLAVLVVCLSLILLFYFRKLTFKYEASSYLNLSYDQAWSFYLDRASFTIAARVVVSGEILVWCGPGKKMPQLLMRLFFVSMQQSQLPITRQRDSDSVAFFYKQ